MYGDVIWMRARSSSFAVALASSWRSKALQLDGRRRCGASTTDLRGRHASARHGARATIASGSASMITSSNLTEGTNG
jgi:hypothetical protein